MSKPITGTPDRANATATGRPTYPSPMTAILRPWLTPLTPIRSALCAAQRLFSHASALPAIGPMAHDWLQPRIRHGITAHGPFRTRSTAGGDQIWSPVFVPKERAEMRRFLALAAKIAVSAAL